MDRRVETKKGNRANRSKPTDIERFVEAPGRKQLVAEVRKKIDALGIDYLYLQFISVTGRIMGKAIPANHWKPWRRRAFSLSSAPTRNWSLNRRADILGSAPKAAD